MPAYHSKTSDTLLSRCKMVGNTPLLPIKLSDRKFRKCMVVDEWVADPDNPDMGDIIDEVLEYYKPNIFFPAFDIKNAADRLIIYGILYVTLALKQLAKCTTKHQGEQEMFKMALNKFSLPGEANFPLNDHFHRPASPEDTDELRRYMMQFRHELGYRLVDRVFDPKLNNGKTDQPSKWWISFSKRKFLKCELTN